MGRFFYKPEGGWAADFIPFYSGGRFRLFYLHDWRDPLEHGEGTPWYQISTDDFVHFVEHGEMLARGGPGEQDLFVFTGSVVQAGDLYHIFCTGHNPHFPGQGKPKEAVMHAISADLLNWRKIPEDTSYASEDVYEPDDWRDPFVFWYDQAQEYWMLLAARLRSGPSRLRGCTALCASRDLSTWEIRSPFWAPGLYHTHECPDLFRMGDWWYLLFSEYSERGITHYRMSRLIDDSSDGRAFYAAKTASDGGRRFLFGWAATREQEQDYRRWQWGGSLIVHEIVQQADGTLTVQAPSTIDDAFAKDIPLHFTTGLGNCETHGNTVKLAAHDSFGCAVAGLMPVTCGIATTVEFAEGTQGCGIMLRASDDLEQAYCIRLEPRRNRLVFDSWPCPGDVPFMVGLERAVSLRPRQHIPLQVFVDGSVCLVYTAGSVAMTTRLYNLQAGNWGCFVTGGSAGFTGTRLSTLV